MFTTDSHTLHRMSCQSPNSQEIQSFKWEHCVWFMQCFSRTQPWHKTRPACITGAHLHNHCCHEEEISTTYSECVFVALGISHTKLMCHIILLCAACLTLYCYILSQERNNFQKTVTEHKMSVLIFSITFVWYISHSKQNSVAYYHKCT